MLGSRRRPGRTTGARWCSAVLAAVSSGRSSTGAIVAAPPSTDRPSHLPRRDLAGDRRRMTSRAVASEPHPLADPGHVLRLGSPEDVAVAVPYLVGHVPHDSVVVLRQRAPDGERGSHATPGRHVPPAMRADLPPPGASGP